MAEGYRVRATGRNAAVAARLREMGAEFMAADLSATTDAGALMADIDVCFHAAALSSPWGAPKAFRAINVEATRRLLDAARRAGCDVFVFVSTPSLYAEPRDRVGLTEASPLARRFANDYAATKYEAEKLVLRANAPGFATIAVRPRALVGPDDQVLLPRLLRVARGRRFPLFRDGQALIELTDVRDAAAALVAADRNRATAASKAFNISGGRPATVRETLTEIFAALGLNPRYLALPYAPVATLAGALEAVCRALPGRPEPPATVYSLSSLAFSQTFDLAGARDGLGWTPRFSPSEAIARTADAWRHHAAV
jgi:nucleoside-diphosphate-sugar epimerase